MMKWLIAEQKRLFKALSTYWFPSLRKRVQRYIDNCLICLLANSSSNSKEGEMQLTDNPTEPFQVVHIDHFGPISESEKGFNTY